LQATINCETPVENMPVTRPRLSNSFHEPRGRVNTPSVASTWRRSQGEYQPTARGRHGRASWMRYSIATRDERSFLRIPGLKVRRL
jgi:hypothetical protein